MISVLRSRVESKGNVVMVAALEILRITIRWCVLHHLFSSRSLPPERKEEFPKNSGIWCLETEEWNLLNSHPDIQDIPDARLGLLTKHTPDTLVVLLLLCN